MNEVWTWNESDLAKLIAAHLDGRPETKAPAYSAPADATLGKLARWGKATALHETRRNPTFGAARPLTAAGMSDLYVGMDGVRVGFEAIDKPPPSNDETRARVAVVIGERMKTGMPPDVAGAQVIGEYLADEAPFQVADGGKPFEMADFSSLNHP